MDSKPQQPVIDQGIVIYNGEKFTYRTFLDMPIGWGHLFPENKPIEIVTLEMEILNAKDKPETIMVHGMGAHKVFWDEEGIAHISVGTTNVFAAIKKGEMELVEIEEQLFQEHARLKFIWDRHYANY